MSLDGNEDSCHVFLPPAANFFYTDSAFTLFIRPGDASDGNYEMYCDLVGYTF